MKYLAPAQLHIRDIVEWRHLGNIMRRGMFIGYNPKDFSELEVTPLEGDPTKIIITMAQYRGLVERDGEVVH